jgi:hypothetical protein
MYVKKKDNPLLDATESWNFADLQRDHPNQKEKSKTQKILPQGSKMEDGIFFWMFVQES